MKKIFSYIDYRTFLSDYYIKMKEETHYFSYRYFAQKAEIGSPGFLKQVIAGERNLTQPTSEKFIAALKLTPKEADYFRLLVAFNQAKTNTEKQKNYTLMLSMADFVKAHPLSSDQYRYYEKWYHPVIRELLCMHDFQDDFTLIAETLTPEILPMQAQNSVELLLRLGLLQKENDGRYYQNSSALTSGNDPMLALARLSFHKQVIEMASRALEQLPKGERHAVAITMGISKACFSVLQQEIEQFKERVLTIVDNDSHSEQVCQFNMQLFRTSKTVTNNLPSSGAYNE